MSKRKPTSLTKTQARYTPVKKRAKPKPKPPPPKKMASEVPVWFITGASSGFGEAIGLEALRRGHKVIATARNSAKLGELRDQGADIMDLDVTADDAVIGDTVAKAIGKHGRITHLVNGAGYILEGALEEAR
jgi:NADP-dependent 3-hydroxy acid dehydrogenase YdfG